MILVPAYGRDYKTAAAVKKDWEAGKDFMISDISAGRENGRYTSIHDTKENGMKDGWVSKGSYIRYNHLAELTHIGVWEEPEL